MELQTHIADKPFLISGDEQAVIELAEQLRKQQRVEYASYIAKHVLTAPLKATGTLVKGIGTALLSNVTEAYQDWELRTYDENHGTNLYIRKQNALVAARTHSLEQRYGL